MCFKARLHFTFLILVLDCAAMPPRRPSAPARQGARARRRASTRARASVCRRARTDRATASSSKMAPGGPLTSAQCEQFEELGYTLVDTPMMADPSWLDKAEATWARKTGAQRSDAIDRGYVELIAHPFFEDVAKQMLRTDHVRTIEHGMHSRPPAQPGPQHAGAEAVAAHDAQREVSQT